MWKIPILLLFTISLCIPTKAQTLERYKVLGNMSISSKALGYKKELEVTVPIEYNANSTNTFPLIIIFDKQNSRSYNYIIHTIDYLTSTEQMPASIVVGVTSEMEKRLDETMLKTSRPNGKGEANEDFIFNELIPLAKTQYHAGNFNVLIGHSRYGYFTNYLLTKHAQQLNAVIAISGFYEQKNVNLLDSLAATANTISKKHVYYSYGWGLDCPSSYDSLQNIIQTFDKTNPLFNSKGYYFPQASHYTVPGLMAGQALYDVFEYWSQCSEAYLTNTNTNDADTLVASQKNILNHYGYALPLSLGTLNGRGWHHFGLGNFEAAIKAWKILLQEYPEFSEGYLYIIDAQKELKQSYTSTIADFKKSLAASSFYTPKEKKELLKELN